MKLEDVKWSRVDLRKILLRRARAFCKKRGITLSTLSKMAVDRGHALKRVAEGADLQVGTFEKIMRHIEMEERRLGRGRRR